MCAGLAVVPLRGKLVRYCFARATFSPIFSSDGNQHGEFIGIPARVARSRVAAVIGTSPVFGHVCARAKKGSVAKNKHNARKGIVFFETCIVIDLIYCITLDTRILWRANLVVIHPHILKYMRVCTGFCAMRIGVWYVAVGSRGAASLQKGEKA